MPPSFLDNPVINSPFEGPRKHFQLDERGVPTGGIVERRRSSEYIVPIAAPRKRGRGTPELQLDLEGGADGRVTPNDYINEIREKVNRWRALPAGQWGVSGPTERLLRYWRDPQRETNRRLFFCQLEAAETIIWLTEVADKRERDRLAAHNAEANPELVRVALKMATGSGKTTVMAMLIAWHAVNKARQPASTRYADAFLVVTPGITIRDRLRVLLPTDPENYYDARDLVPPDMRDDVKKARVVITNFHAFKPRETMEAPKLTKELLKGHGEAPITVETEGQMVARVCPELMGRKQIVVINDEAHHCYREKVRAEGEAEAEEDIDADSREEAKRNTEAARLWISGIEALQRVLKAKATIYDLSATPFFLRGSGYPEGTLFPWVVSDFSLMDAIECGIVKVPRVPVSDSAVADMPMFRNLYENIQKGSGVTLPKAGRSRQGKELDPTKLPTLLIGALEALYENYRKTFEMWEAEGHGTPPVFIVVCNNTSTSKLVCDFISGYRSPENPDVLQPGHFPLFNNIEPGPDGKGRWRDRPHTLLIDSEQLDSGGALSPEFKAAAALEIESFKRDYRIRYPGRDADSLDDADLLREVMNTVGKKDRLGEQVRCVVSVSMLTEGWDANTVTHILGVRKFGTQLLCEQVVGRGLRRVSYDPDENDMFTAEYADILGIPFAFAAQPTVSAPQKPRKAVRVHALEDRIASEIRFPNVRGYRVILPREKLVPKFTRDSRLVLDPEDTPPKTINDPIVGEGAVLTLDHLKQHRLSEVAFSVAGYALRQRFKDEDGNLKPYLFPSLLAITREWLGRYLVCKGGTMPQYLLWTPLAEKAAEKLYLACVPNNAGEEHLRPILDPYNPEGSSRHVDFTTTKQSLWKTKADRCHVNFVVFDSDWEAKFAETVEDMPEVRAYVKNHGLHFEVPYVLAGDDRRYRPDFILRIDDGRGPDDLLNLIVEIKGYRGEDAAMKADTIKRLWIPAVNNAARFGRWDFLEIRQLWDTEQVVRKYLAKIKAAA